METIFNAGFIKTDDRNDVLLSKDIKTKYKELNNNSGKGEKLFITYLVDTIGCELDASNRSKHKVLMVNVLILWISIQIRIIEKN